jgi:hypothetical protein
MRLSESATDVELDLSAVTGNSVLEDAATAQAAKDQAYGMAAYMLLQNS